MAKPPRRGGRGVNQKGRSKFGPPFVMLHQYIFDCPAYRSLKDGPRNLLWELIRRYNGTNNGRIALGLREACMATLRSDKDTVARYFRELEERGFIRRVTPGGFNMKDRSKNRATEWALTWEWLNDTPPTKEFMDWRPEIHGPEKPALGSAKSGQ